MKTTNLFLFLAVIILIAGCASNPVEIGDYFQLPNSSTSKNMANIYIYNPYAQPKNDQPTVYIDNKKIVKLPNNTYTLLPISPGIHMVGIQNTDFFGEGKIRNATTIHIYANKTYYLEYYRKMQATLNMPMSQTVTTYVDARTFILIDSYSKASNIAMCRFVRPLADKI